MEAFFLPNQNKDLQKCQNRERFSLQCLVIFYTFSGQFLAYWTFHKIITISHFRENKKEATTKDVGLMCPRPMCPRPKILGCCAPWILSPWLMCPPTLDRVKHGTSSVGLWHLRDQWGVCTLGPHIELHRFTALKCSTFGSRVSLRSIWI